MANGGETSRDPSVVTDPEGKRWRAPSLASADRERVRWGGFEAFCRMALPHLALVGKRPMWNWHMSEMCSHFQALHDSPHIHQCITNTAPGSIKSTIKSILGPAWIWTHTPSHKFMVATYNRELTDSMGRQTAELVRGRWYVERWGDLLPDVTNQHDYFTLHGGRRFGTTCPGGPGVGVHADTYVIDDPNKPADIMKGEKIGQFVFAVNQWIGSSVVSRARPGAYMKIDLTQQRLHEEDASGFLKSTLGPIGDLVHLELPYRFEPERRCVTPFGGDHRHVEGAWMWDESTFKTKCATFIATNGGVDSEAVAAQLRQEPGKGSDKIFPGPFKRFTRMLAPVVGRPEEISFQQCLSCISVDPTFTGQVNSDYVAIEVWGYYMSYFYCFHSEQAKRGYNDTLAAIRNVRMAWPATHVVIEAAANGHALADTLEGDIAGIVRRPPGVNSKIMRARAASAFFGRVFFLEGAEWFERKTRNLKRFPGTKHDDDVDTTTQAILYLNEMYGAGGDLMAAMKAWREGDGASRETFQSAAREYAENEARIVAPQRKRYE